MRSVEIESVEDYLKVIKQSKETNIQSGNNQGFLFRGQTADHPLLSKICRLKARGDLLQTERLLLQEFKRTNPLLIEQHRPMDDWDYLTLGQHFGLPTRLLDWSDNALTALWFATSNMRFFTMPESDYAVVWILMPNEEDYNLDIEKVQPFDVPFMKIIKPRIIKQRINNQSGVFSVASSREVVEKRVLDEAGSYDEKLIKIKISSAKFDDIRTDMNTLGVNAFSLFPELEGLCAHLQWQYFE
jgi:hypothetical protein